MLTTAMDDGEHPRGWGGGLLRGGRLGLPLVPGCGCICVCARSGVGGGGGGGGTGEASREVEIDILSSSSEDDDDDDDAIGGPINSGVLDYGLRG